MIRKNKPELTPEQMDQVTGGEGLEVVCGNVIYCKQCNGLFRELSVDGNLITYICPNGHTITLFDQG